MTLPTPQPARLAALDALRGFAILGILVMNIQSFAMPEAAYNAPNSFGDFTGANFAVWLLSKALVEQKFMTLFSLLFGAGIALQGSRVDHPARIHYRRMLVLLAIGLAHAYLIWYGDILVSYALCGMLVYPLRKIKTPGLILVGAAILAAQNEVTLAAYGNGGAPPGRMIATLFSHLQFQTLTPGQEITAYTGGYLSNLHHRLPAALEGQTQTMLTYSLWRVCGLACWGMAAARAGLFLPTFPLRRLALPWLAITGIGATLVTLGIRRALHIHWQGNWYISVVFYDYWGSLFLGLAWAGVILWIARRPWSRILDPLARVGRLSLTNYLLQSIICTAIFYGWGLGWFGRVQRVGQIQIVVAVWIVQLVFSALWTTRFRFGPAEWLWRSLTYGRRQPWRIPQAG